MHIQGELFQAPSQNFLLHLVRNSTSRVRSDFLRERLREGSLDLGLLVILQAIQT